MSIIQAVAFNSSSCSLVRCVEDEGDGFFTTSYWLNGASLCFVCGSLFPDKGEQPTVFFFTEKMVGPEVEEAFAAVAFELFGKRFTIEEAKEYSLTGKPVTINKRTAIFQSMPF